VGDVVPEEQANLVQRRHYVLPFLPVLSFTVVFGLRLTVPASRTDHGPPKRVGVHQHRCGQGLEARHSWRDAEELAGAVRACVELYNTGGLIERHGHRTPREAYLAATARVAA